MKAAAALMIGALCAAAPRGAAAQDSTKAPAGKSTLAGVFSEAQATRGEAVYKATCIECHVPTDYQGEAFKSKFVGGTVFDMWDLIRSSMPQNNPGSLPDDQYTDVVAYLFKLNDLPSGAKDMPSQKDSLKAIKVEAKPE